ncbi:hypothetical protein FCV25MIE_28943 [Fagus crenata]
MLENPTPTTTPTPTPTTTPPTAPPPDTAIKRYAPPNQRTRSLHRRKSSDRFDRTNHLYANDVEKNQVSASRNVPSMDHGDSGSSNLLNENPRSGLIALQGCCSSEAFQLLHDRWAAALHCYQNPSIDISERPVMYSGSAASACNFRLPHQMMPPVGAGPSGSQMDFLAELRRQMRNSNASCGT